MSKIEGFHNFDTAKDPDESKRKMEDMERSNGLNDFHVILHLSEEEQITCRRFIMTGVDEKNGGIIFLARGACSPEEVLAMAFKNVNGTLKILAAVLEMTISQVVSLIEKDELMEEILKRQRRQG
ncbi:MAG: hypothetical protein PHI12_08235 [Dehalococcoidales bacterium]|nr:hypothetical protein [Dehalococcoidales bacterium]